MVLAGCHSPLGNNKLAAAEVRERITEWQRSAENGWMHSPGDFFLCRLAKRLAALSVKVPLISSERNYTDVQLRESDNVWYFGRFNYC